MPLDQVPCHMANIFGYSNQWATGIRLRVISDSKFDDLEMTPLRLSKVKGHQPLRSSATWRAYLVIGTTGLRATVRELYPTQSPATLK